MNQAIVHLGRTTAFLFCSACIVLVMFLAGCRENQNVPRSERFTDYINNAEKNETSQSNAQVNLAF